MIKVAAAALFLATQVSSAHAQTLSGGDMGPDISLWRIVAALILCLALAGGAVFALRHRFGGAGPLTFFASSQRRMQLIEAIRPHPAIAICLIRCDDKDYLIAVGAQGGSLIERIEAPKQSGGTP